MLRSSCVVLLLAALLMLWCGEAEAAPTFGLLLRLLTNNNGTNVLADFAELGLQTKINALDQLADLIQIAAASSSSGTTTYTYSHAHITGSFDTPYLYFSFSSAFVWILRLITEHRSRPKHAVIWL